MLVQLVSKTPQEAHLIHGQSCRQGVRFVSEQTSPTLPLRVFQDHKVCWETLLSYIPFENTSIKQTNQETQTRLSIINYNKHNYHYWNTQYKNENKNIQSLVFVFIML